MPLPSGFKTKEEYAQYMRGYRRRKKAKIEKLTADHDFYKKIAIDSINALHKTMRQLQELSNFVYFQVLPKVEMK